MLDCPVKPDNDTGVGLDNDTGVGLDNDTGVGVGNDRETMMVHKIGRWLSFQYIMFHFYYLPKYRYSNA